MPGQVIVIAAAGGPDAAMIGELLSGAARRKGLAGVVVDGPVRDIATLAAWADFPVFARAARPAAPPAWSGARSTSPSYSAACGWLRAT